MLAQRRWLIKHSSFAYNCSCIRCCAVVARCHTRQRTAWRGHVAREPGGLASTLLLMRKLKTSTLATLTQSETDGMAMIQKAIPKSLTCENVSGHHCHLPCGVIAHASYGDCPSTARLLHVRQHCKVSAVISPCSHVLCKGPCTFFVSHTLRLDMPAVCLAGFGGGVYKVSNMQ